MLDLSTLSWKWARKTALISFKHYTAVLVIDPSSFLVKTLEGVEELTEDSMVCRGVDGEYWLQSSTSLFSRYRVTGVSSQGWYTGVPIADAPILVSQIITPTNAPSTFTVKTMWGQDMVHGESIVTVQHGVSGDWVCRSALDHSDVWIVKEHIFARTYEVQS